MVIWRETEDSGTFLALKWLHTREGDAALWWVETNACQSTTMCLYFGTQLNFFPLNINHLGYENERRYFSRETKTPWQSVCQDVSQTTL